METWATWVLAFHIVGVVLWFMGMMRSANLLGAAAAADATENKIYANLARRMVFAGVIPGMIVALGTGLTVLFRGYPGGFAYFKKAGWMHTKIMLILVLIGISVYLIIAARKAMTAEPGTMKAVPFKALHGVLGLMLIIIAVLAVVKPFTG